MKIKSIEFLEESLNRIFSFHHYLEIRYEYRSFINTHIIEVKPIHCFESDKQYIDQQIELQNQFEEMFPNEEILFITENPLIKITNPNLILGVNSQIDCDLITSKSTILEFEIEDTPFSNIPYVICNSNQGFTEIEIDFFDGNEIQKSKFITFDIRKLTKKFKKINSKRKKDSGVKSESFFLIL